MASKEDKMKFKDLAGNFIIKPIEYEVTERKSVYLIGKYEDEYLLIIPVWAEWLEFPGGRIERDESEKEALRREVFEELGIEIEKEMALRFTQVKENFYNNLTDEFFYSTMTFYLYDFESRPVIEWIKEDEVKSFTWFKQAELSESILNPSYSSFLSDLV